MSELVKVNFQGDKIDCVKDSGGVWVLHRRLCDNIGLDAKSQRDKLQNKAWACGVMITSHDSSGRKQEQYMLHLDSVPMWLATIDAERVAESVRPKIELYQKKCAQVLRDYFFGKSSANKAQSESARIAASREERMKEAERRRTSTEMMRMAQMTKDQAIITKTALAALDMLMAGIGRRPTASEEPDLGWQSASFVSKATAVEYITVGRIATALFGRREIPGMISLGRQSITVPGSEARDVPLWLYAGPALRMLVETTRYYAAGKFESIAKVAEWGKEMLDVYGIPRAGQELLS